MRFLYWFFFSIVALGLIAFALSNRGDVTVALWPFSDGVAIPLFEVALAPAAIGLILGAMLGGLSGIKSGFAARSNAKRANAAEREVAALRATNAPVVSPPATLVIPPGELG